MLIGGERPWRPVGRGDPMRVSVRAAAGYDLPGDSMVVLMVEPALAGPSHRVVEERLLTTPTRSSSFRVDGAGNPQRRLVVARGTFSYTFTATVDVEPETPVPSDAVEHPPQDVPAEVLVYTLPSRYCQSDLLVRMARSEFGAMEPGGGRVRAVADWVRERVEYRYGTTDSRTSAYDTATERIGVCRDFAHLVIALCRALDVPSRYASGYSLGLEPPDFHGIAQVYLGGRWHNVDATTESLRPAFVPIAVGRDAADVAMTTLWGEATVVSQSVEVREVAGGA